MDSCIRKFVNHIPVSNLNFLVTEIPSSKPACLQMGTLPGGIVTMSCPMPMVSPASPATEVQKIVANVTAADISIWPTDSNPVDALFHISPNLRNGLQGGKVYTT